MQKITQLDDRQDRAVRSLGKTIAVVAGPGSGKTRTLVERILARLLGGHGVLAFSFTRVAAEEIAQRVELRALEIMSHAEWQLLRQNLNVSTAHAFAMRIVTDNKERFGFMASPTLLSEKEVESILKSIKENTGEKATATDLRRAAGGATDVSTSAVRVLDYARAAMLRSGQVDFAGLIARAVSQLGDHGDSYTKKLRDQFGDVVVDEAQDQSKSLQQMIVAFAPTGAMFMVGDPRQAIYGFAGGDCASFQKFVREADDRIVLDYNYRSHVNIIEYFNAYDPGLGVEVNNDSAIATAIVPCIPKRTEEKDVLGRFVKDAEIESYARIADWIEPDWRDVAILAPTNRIVDAVADGLLVRGRNHVRVTGAPVSGPADLWYRSYLRLLVNPYDFNSAQFYLCGWAQTTHAGDQIYNSLRAECRKFEGNQFKPEDSPGPLVDFAYAEMQRYKACVDAGWSVEDYLTACSKSELSAAERNRNAARDKDAIQAMTVHQSKGREFAHVIVIKQGFRWGAEQDKKLYYVALSRAKDTLTVLQIGSLQVERNDE